MIPEGGTYVGSVALVCSIVFVKLLVGVVGHPPLSVTATAISGVVGVPPIVIACIFLNSSLCPPKRTVPTQTLPPPPHTFGGIRVPRTLARNAITFREL